MADIELLTQLRQLLSKRFSDGELRTLCFDLGVAYEDLPGSGKADKARELVDYMDRHERLADLVRVGRQYVTGRSMARREFRTCQQIITASFATPPPDLCPVYHAVPTVYGNCWPFEWASSSGRDHRPRWYG